MTTQKSLQLSYPARERILKIISILGLSIIALFTVLPFLWMISTSLKPDLKAVYVFPPQWIPNPPSWKNYVDAWNAAPFDRYLINSLIVSFSGMALQVINACLCAYVFSRIKFPGRDLIFLLFLAVMMIPGQVTVIPNYIVISNLSWINTY